ncbi:hypothetical protein LNAT_P0307 [Lebetimonas natsushimae]|uniref:HTH cro/C1-type domain-containing protein n=1 Tax=Lebetimonas natsushimae TaxID=1936991 RepID=A0A292Y894_9BACT|nr:helix-turn-helix transcriptional regulator [Lebetimonas natsushimae]GAX87012.1 hypothetical protein LNAT_P0307 [Lebetimonas natsushimae]
MKKNEFLKNIRKKYNMSQKKFAEYLDISKSLIEKVEMGKIPATSENKYVKAVCALEGLDNEIFKYDEITKDILEEYELIEFSKKFRKFLYFYYGDFWNEKINKDIYEKLKNTIKELFTIKNKETDQIPNCSYETESFIEEILQLIKKRKKFEVIDKKLIGVLIDDCEYYFPIIGKILLLIMLKKSYSIYFVISDFLIKEELQSFFNCNNCINFAVFTQNKELNINSLDFTSLRKEIQELEKKGIAFTIENIKKFKQIVSLKTIKPLTMEMNKVSIKQIVNNVINDLSIDPKDQKILELLHYAPPAFKDKIIEKLEKFRDEVEGF